MCEIVVVHSVIQTDCLYLCINNQFYPTHLLILSFCCMLNIVLIFCVSVSPDQATDFLYVAVLFSSFVSSLW